MSVRGIARYATPKGVATPTNSPIYVDSDDNKLKMIPAGTGSTEVEIVDASTAQTLTNKTLTNPTIASSTGTPYLSDATNVGGGKKIAYGSSAFVSGAKTLATGLASILSFNTQLAATGFATGATEVTAAVINGATGVLATGDVAVQGYRLFTVTASVSGTGVFDWIAIGT